jgi:hypothetical protein
MDDDSEPMDGVVLVEASQDSLEHEDGSEEEGSWAAAEPQQESPPKGAPWTGVAAGWAGAGLRRHEEDGGESEPLLAVLSDESLEAELSTVLEEGSNEQVSSIGGGGVASSVLADMVESAVSRVPEPEPEPEPEPPQGGVPSLRQWLTELGAADYHETFVQEGFEDVPSVMQSRLTEEDLRELGMLAMVRHPLPRRAVRRRAAAAHAPAALTLLLLVPAPLQAPRKRVLHAMNDALLAADDPAALAAGPGLTAAVQQLLAALQPAVPAVLAQLQRLDPDGAGTIAMAEAAAAPPPRPVSAPVRTRGLLPQHVSRRPVVADLAAAASASAASSPQRSARTPSPPPRSSRSPPAGQFSIGGADLAAFSLDAPLAAAAVASAKPKAKPKPKPKLSPAPAAAAAAPVQPSVGRVGREMSAEEFAERLQAELSNEDGLGVGLGVAPGAPLAASSEEEAAELAQEIRTAVLAWRARSDP